MSRASPGADAAAHGHHGHHQHHPQDLLSGGSDSLDLQASREEEQNDSGKDLKLFRLCVYFFILMALVLELLALMS